MQKKYTKSEYTGKVYDEEVLAETNAVDENHWTTDIQNYQYEIEKEKLDSAERLAALGRKIADAEAERDDYFAQKTADFAVIADTPPAPVEIITP